MKDRRLALTKRPGARVYGARAQALTSACLTAMRSSASSTTTGRVLAARPKSASHTSPWRGGMTVKDVEDFLLHLTTRQDVGPFLLPTPVLEETQVMPELAHDLLGLPSNGVNQPFLRNHVRRVTEIALASKNPLSGNLPEVRAGDDSNL